MRTLRLLIVAALVAVSLAPASAGKHVRLGRDPAGDGQPGLDVTYLDVGVTGKALDIRIGTEMLPAIGGYPELPGIEWAFDVKGRTFLAEAAIVDGEPTFFFFEKEGGGFTMRTPGPKGTYNPDDGYIKILVPLNWIGAKSGTRISGVGKTGTEDVDAHVHLGVTTHYPDKMATTKDFIVP